MNTNPAIITAEHLREQGVYFDHPSRDEKELIQDSPPREPSPSNGRPRTAQACDKCRERKTKCSGERPTCNRCSNRGLLCHYSERAGRSRRARNLSPFHSDGSPEKLSPRKAHHSVDSQDVAPSSIASSANAYKSYQYPNITRGLSATNSAYVSPSPSPPMAPDAGQAISPNRPPAGAPYVYQPAPGHPHYPSNTHSESVRGPSDTLPQVAYNIPSWNPPLYPVASKDQATAAMERLDHLQLNGFSDRGHDPRALPIRVSFPSPVDERGMRAGHLDSVYAAGPPHPPRDAHTGYSASSFLEFADAFMPPVAPTLLFSDYQLAREPQVGYLSLVQELEERKRNNARYY